MPNYRSNSALDGRKKQAGSTKISSEAGKHQKQRLQGIQENR